MSSLPEFCSSKREINFAGDRLIKLSLTIRTALNDDVSAAKNLADACREEIGFIPRQSFEESAAKNELLVAYDGDVLLGFLRFHLRRDKVFTVYEVAVAPQGRGFSVGRQLFERLRDDGLECRAKAIRLLCPVELEANKFYQSIGFERAASRSESGRTRPLYEWILPLLPARRFDFVASMTAATSDVGHLVRLWEAEGQRERPFDWCIVTPLWSESGALRWTRYMSDNWGLQVMFDSGGFYVQQEKLAYEDLFARLLQFYNENRWAHAYVLPDYVPTSRQSEAQVQERVYVTAAEGLKFLARLPEELKDRALGVMQGHTLAQIDFCFRAFVEAGLTRIGFGSFDTGGANSEINLLTDASFTRLEGLRSLLVRQHRARPDVALPQMHFFGVSSPNHVARFPHYGATSFDSSGWMRTAGMGNVYLPFRGRRNVSHGSSSLMAGRGLSAREFYADCERTQHDCPFCRDYPRLQSNRFVRMLHNAVVFREMTERIALSAAA